MNAPGVNPPWAVALLEGLHAGGVRHAVISPGSRSTPITLACARDPRLKTWVVPDERSAAFFALGLSKAEGVPAMVVATSGSAPANWYPAVVESSYGHVPLVLVSADRPRILQDCGANQTIDQCRLFGPLARDHVDLPEPVASDQARQRVRLRAMRAAQRARWPVPGPVHMNLPLAEPLVETDVPTQGGKPLAPLSVPRLEPEPGDLQALAERLCSGNGLMVCGPGPYPAGFARAVTHLAAELDCPLLADPLSGLRFGPHDHTHVIVHYDAFLRPRATPAFSPPDWVFQFGAAPTSKALLQYLESLPVGSLHVVTPFLTWPDPTGRAGRVLHADPLRVCIALTELGLEPTAPAWRESLFRLERLSARVLDTMDRRPLEAETLADLARLAPEQTTLFCGNSMVVRDADSFLSGGLKTFNLVGSRGASGIDGNVSTSLGVAAASDGPVIALLGDLALFHDMNGLYCARGLDVTLVVYNNGGGAIFGYLPQARLREFERYWLTPPGLDLRALCGLFTLRHHRVDTPEDFAPALEASLAQGGTHLIEVVVNREESLRRHQAYWRAVAALDQGQP